MSCNNVCRKSYTGLGIQSYKLQTQPNFWDTTAETTGVLLSALSACREPVCIGGNMQCKATTHSGLNAGM